jgi:DNA-binding transcriptional regulator LsrR (DeoR family)
MSEPAMDSRSDISGAERRLAARAARMYYTEDKSKVTIAAELGLSRFKVARLLGRARAEGLVTVTVRDPDLLDHELSDRLAAVLGIRRVLVADAPEPQHWLEAVAALAALHLQQIVTRDSVLGIAWSRATRALADRLTSLPPCTVVQLCGVLAQAHGEEHNVELVRKIAQQSGGAAFTFYAPLVLPDAVTARTLRAQPGIADALSECAHVSVAVIAVGQWQAGASTVFDALSMGEARSFTDRGVVAESAGMLFDAQGRLIDEGFVGRVVAITQPQLRKVHEVVALATEPDRVSAIRAICRSGLISTLVTHRAVAEAVLATNPNHTDRHASHA